MVVVDKLVTHPSHCKTPGRVLIMGQGDFGQLGLGESLTERKKPYPVKGELSDKEVVQVKCGGMHTAALTTDGKVDEYIYVCKNCLSKGCFVSSHFICTNELSVPSFVVGEVVPIVCFIQEGPFY